MCLAVPGQVESIREENGTRMGRVNFGGVVKEVCLAYLPEIAVGDYTIVHVGFAISKIDEASARDTLRTFALSRVSGNALGTTRAGASTGTRARSFSGTPERTASFPSETIVITVSRGSSWPPSRSFPAAFSASVHLPFRQRP